MRARWGSEQKLDDSRYERVPIGGRVIDQEAAAINYLAFYVGWPNVFSAMPVAKAVFEKRPK